MTFGFRDRELRVLAGYSTPLYETIAEVVDYDCYQLGRLHPDVLQNTTLIDIGANVGVTTLCLAQFPQARVLSFEPDPDNCARLEANLRQNGASNVTVVRKAVFGSSAWDTYSRSKPIRSAGPP
jgi:tRNA/tmRNA/rRNA uracil-C5-methylase (TrmA/RlmC/RlmD family)